MGCGRDAVRFHFGRGTTLNNELMAATGAVGLLHCKKGTHKRTRATCIHFLFTVVIDVASLLLAAAAEHRAHHWHIGSWYLAYSQISRSNVDNNNDDGGIRKE